MSGELNNDIFRRKRPIPIPIYDSDRYIDRPYLRKHELAKIRDNLDELVDIKTGSDGSTNLTDSTNKSKDKSSDLDIKQNEPKMESKKDDFFLSKDIDKQTNNKTTDTTVNFDSKVEFKASKFKVSEFKVPEVIESKMPEVIETKVTEIKKDESKVAEIKKDELKFGISNLAYNKEIKKIDVVDDKKAVIDNKKIDVKLTDVKPKVNKRKVIRRMNDEESNYNISPEERRRMRKAEIKEFHEEDESNKAIRRAAELAEQNKRELEEMKKTLATENAEIRKELKNEFGTKFNELGGRFNDITGKFDKVSGKLEETCTGIECLKKDLANMNKNFELMECPECGEKVVPPLSSFCPRCSAKIHGWTDDDGKLIKGWKPNWEK